MSFGELVIEDTTLRDGEQTPGVAFGFEDKLRVFRALVGVGLRWIEAGIPAMGGDELRALRQMLAESEEATVVAWNRGVVEDVEQSLREGFRAIHIGLPASDVLLRGSVAKDRKWLLQHARELIARAKDAGAFVSVSAEDAGRTELGPLVEYAVAVTEAGADRLRLSDTVGVMTPEGYGERVRAVKEATGIAVQCHCHNDFGLAVANTLAGVRAGATHFHVTVNGIGERAGMPDLGQLSLALRCLYGHDLSLRTEQFRELSLLVSRLTGVECPPWQPVVGANVFAHESGIHVKGVLRDPNTFEPFEPELVGAERTLLLGKHSGRTLIRTLLESDGHEPSDEDLTACLALVRVRATASGGRRVTLGQLRQIYSGVIG